MSNDGVELCKKLVKKILKSMTDPVLYHMGPLVLAKCFHDLMIYNSMPPTTFNKTLYYLLMGISCDLSQFTTYLVKRV